MRMGAPDLIGRDGDVAAVEASLKEAAAGRGSALLVVGPPGIGRSRFAKEVAARAFDSGMVVLRGRGSSLGPAVPFRPLREALLSLVRTTQLDDAALGPYRAVLGRLIPEWHQPGADHDLTSVVVLAEAVLRALAVAGRQGGCLIVVDDLHEVDGETLAVVEYLADNLESVPVMLLGTLRSERSEALDLAESLERRRSAQVTELGPLGHGDVRALVASCLGVDVEEVPEALADRIPDASAGNPFVAEELLRGMVSEGRLVPGAGSWAVVGDAPPTVPPSLVRLTTQRLERLGAQGVAILTSAAVIGRRFPLSVLRRMTGLDDGTLFGHLHAAVAAQFVAPDDTGPDWYTFNHPLTADALLARVGPADRVDLSRSAADALQAGDAPLDGEGRQLLATLLIQARRPAEAARHLLEAGQRALADGAIGSAITFMERAERLLADAGDAAQHTRAVDVLLGTLIEAGRIDQALQLADQWDTPAHRRPGPDRAALHVRLAWLALHGGRHAAAETQVDLARDCLGRDPREQDLAPLDAVSAAIALTDPSSNGLVRAAELARRAATVAEQVGLPEVACQALQTVGAVAREQDLSASVAAFEHARRLAEEHDLPVWRLYALIGAAGSRWLAEGDTTALERARDEALRTGAILMSMVVRGILGLDHVLQGRFEQAERELDAVIAEATRMRATSVVVYCLMARAVLDAHRARPADAQRHLAAFAAQGGERSGEMPLAVGLGRAVCALLLEDRALARRELDAVARRQRTSSTTFFLTGQYGLGVLLDVLDGAATGEDVERVVATSAGGMRWNRQFLHLARAVVQGRAGHGADAEVSVATARRDGAAYPVARALGLRLVSEAALADGWGRPADWLREAEEHLHRQGAATAASACRAMLRSLGETVRQRREGVDRVPDELRRLGVTIREYEVFELLVERLTNKELASRLHISPRTVEKHVASLLLKTGQQDRTSLTAFAASLRD